MGFHVALVVKNPPANADIRDTKYPLEKGMVTHSSALAWRISWTEEPGRLSSMGSQKSQTRLKQLSTHARTTVTMLPFLWSANFSGLTNYFCL